MKKVEKVKRWAVDWLLPFDVFNVLQWILAVQLGNIVLAWIFGEVNAPARGMSYITSAFQVISTFSIYLVGTWITLRIFFPEISKYFTEKTGSFVYGEKMSRFKEDCR